LKHGQTRTRIRYENNTVPFGETCKKQTQTQRCDNGKLSSWSGSYAATSCKEAAPADCGSIKHGQKETRTRYEKSTVPYGASCKKQTQTRSCTNGKLSSWSGNYTASSCKQTAAADCGNIKHGQKETRTRYEKSTVAYGTSCKTQTQTRSCTNGKLSSWSGSYTVTSCRVAPWETILSERVGFGRGAKGGSGGPLCDVTNLDDAGTGSLRACAEASGARWIRFKVSGTIKLKKDIRVASFKTIDGRGATITIAGYGLLLSNVQHVIILNLRFDDGSSSAEDAISITSKARHIWIDHVHLEEYPDGLIDIKRESTDITVSWCRFEDHDKVMLIGHSASHTVDTVIRVTLHHNYFRRTTQRHPRLRFGKVHAFNNYLYQWKSYGMVSCMKGELLSEHNIFEAGSAKDAIRSSCPDPDRGYVESRRDWQLNGATVDEYKTSKVFDDKKPPYGYTLQTANSSLRSAISSGAGRRTVAFPQ
jgi:pectate lyase